MFAIKRIFNHIGALKHATWALALAVLAFTSIAPAARAQSPDVDPPARVGRLSDIVGPVWFFSPDNTDWVSAGRNRPLTTGDWLSTDAGGQAEVQIGSVTVRLGENSDLEVRQIDDQRVSLQLHKGSVWTHLRNAEAVAEFELLTDEGRFHAQRIGSYRVDRSDNSSLLGVYTGQAYYEGPRNALTVYAGQRAQFWIEAGNTAQYSLTDLQNDGFSAWNNERDRAQDYAASARYVSPEMTGADDLDRYGVWEQSPDYGALWIPRGVAAGWVPYSTGHWAWVRPWGWTWVDDAPWGFAPFHYGRWVYARNVWCWAPGVRIPRPVYAPALVAWVGGPSVNVSVNIGGGAPNVGWFPLAPREVYVPSYRASPRYSKNINVTNVTNITNITTVINNPQAPREFRNRGIPNAVTIVPASVVASREPVAPAAGRLRDGRGVPGVDGRGQRQVPPVAALAGPVSVTAPVAAPPAPVARPVDTARPNDPRVGRPPVRLGAPAGVPERVPAPPSAARPERPDLADRRSQTDRPDRPDAQDRRPPVDRPQDRSEPADRRVQPERPVTPIVPTAPAARLPDPAAPAIPPRPLPNAGVPVPPRAVQPEAVPAPARNVPVPVAPPVARPSFNQPAMPPQRNLPTREAEERQPGRAEPADNAARPQRPPMEQRRPVPPQRAEQPMPQRAEPAPAPAVVPAPVAPRAEPPAAVRPAQAPRPAAAPEAPKMQAQPIRNRPEPAERERRDPPDRQAPPAQPQPR